MSNKTRILETALALFNDKGTRSVTTNHIAQAASISPGNLYYHFKNKEAIIFALFEQMIKSWDSNEGLPENLQTNLIDAQFSKVFEFVWQYRFIHRELSPLLQADDALKQFCVPVLQQRIIEIKNILELLQNHQVITKLDETTTDFLSNSLLYYPLFWQNYLDAIGEKPTKAKVSLGVQMMKQLILPYLK